MSYEVIKTIRGRQYRYRQTSYREGGKVRTKMEYLGPVNGYAKRKKRGGGFPAINPLNLVMGAIALAAHIAKYGRKTPSYKTRDRASGRDRQAQQAAMRDLNRRYGIDTSSAIAYRATYGAMSREQRTAFMRDVLGQAPKNAKSGTQSPVWREFDERVAARQASQDAPGRTQAPAPKNFTVDDEIDAREAKFHAAQEEVNAARGYGPAEDIPTPDDMPTFDPGDAPSTK